MPAEVAEGITELRGRDLYVNVHSYATAAAAGCRWESHRHTIDVQYCITGGEIIDWLPSGSLMPQQDYAIDKDTEHWQPATTGRPTQLMMASGTFALFFAGELHRPKVSDRSNRGIRKLVVKIHAPLLEQ